MRSDLLDIVPALCFLADEPPIKDTHSRCTKFHISANLRTDPKLHYIHPKYLLLSNLRIYIVFWPSSYQLLTQTMTDLSDKGEELVIFHFLIQNFERWKQHDIMLMYM